VTSPTFRCADAARDRRDPLVGTAPVSQTYLLIEHPGPWRFDALTGTGWSAEVVAELASAVRASHGRLLLIRRPGRRTRESNLSWAVVRVGVGSQWSSWQHETDLLAAATALRTADDSAPTYPSRRPVLLVCAHGVHDACCAIRGRPVAAALADQWPDETWECSHVGGDRFAANLVVLPDGTYYGGLDVDTALPVVSEHLAGRVTADYLRGSVRWPPVAQVAVAELHRRLGPLGADDLRVEQWTVRGAGRWSVRVSSVDGRRHVLDVAAEKRPPALLTCSARGATSATGYRVVSIAIDA
jgi:hypothetical protein